MAAKDPVEFRLYDTDLTTVLGILPGTEMNLYLQLNEPGSGQMKIPLNSRAASVIASGQFVQNKYRGGVRGGFFVENPGEDIVNAGEKGGQWKSISGRGAMALLADAVVWHDGTGSTQRTFSGTRAGIIIQLIQEAQNRGALQVLDYDFSETVDSDSETWDDDEPLTLPVGKSLLDVVREIAKTGIDFDITPDGSGSFVLSAYKNGVGEDKSSTVYFRVGQNCEELSSQESGGDIANALLLKYQGGYTLVKNSASITARRRRENVLDVAYAGNSQSARMFGNAELDVQKDPRKQISVRVYDGTGPRAFVDYGLGDTVTLDKNGTEETYRVRGMQLSWNDGKFADVVLDLNSIILENEIRMAQDIEWLKDLWKTAKDANQLEVRYWAAIGGNDSNITAIYATHIVDGILYVGGNFTRIGGVNATNIAAYNIATGQWSALPSSGSIGIESGYVLCLASIGTDLFVGGYAGERVARYDTDGGAWSSMDGGVYIPGVDAFAAVVRAMTVSGSDLYVTGYFTRADSGTPVTVASLAKWSGSAWSDVGGGITGGGTVGSAQSGFALVMNGTDLIIGGNFSALGGAALGTHNNIGKWTGSAFAALGSGLDERVFALAVDTDSIYAGGVFTGHVAEWSGSAWSVLAGGVDDDVYGLAVYLSDVYLTGEFTDKGNHIALCSGEEWSGLEDGINNTGYAITVEDGIVYVGGIFTAAGGRPAEKIAAYFTTFESLVEYLENSGEFDLGAAIHGATAKTSLTGADEIPLWDSVSQALRKITWTNIVASIRAALDLVYVALTGNQTIGGVKTFTSFPVTPSSAPTTDYQVANKKYVDDNSWWSLPTMDPNRVVLTDGDGNIYTSDDFLWDAATNTFYILGTNKSVGLQGRVIANNVLLAPVFLGQVAGNDGADNPDATPEDQALARILARGHDGTDWVDSTRGEIVAVADGDWSPSSQPVRWELYVTPAGSTSKIKALTLRSDGSLNLEAGGQYLVDGSPIGGGEPDTTEYRLDVTVTSNNLTVALKNKDGDDPSSSVPVKIKIGGVVRTIESALSVTANANTNWCNAGGNELKTLLVQYFVYLGYNSTDGVTIGFSRIPYARYYGDFSTTSTDNLYCKISTITNAASTDAYKNIGRFSATLSAGASYNWSISGTGDVIHHSIDHTDTLEYSPQWTSTGTQPAIGSGTLVGIYQVTNIRCEAQIRLASSSTTWGTGTYTFSLPFAARTSSMASYQNTASVFDSSASQFLLGNTSLNSGASGFRIVTHGSGNIGATSPVTFANPDSIFGFCNFPLV